MKPGSWPSVALIYLYGVMASASLSKIIPLQGDLAAQLNVSVQDFALLISLLALLPALLASLAGSIIDRIGARKALILAACVGVSVNFAYLHAASLRGFQVIRVFEGLVNALAYSAAPALIMATAPVERRKRAMAFWSTYTPVGISLGLVLAANFAGTAHWRGGYAVHLALFAVLAAAGFLLPQPPRGAGAAAPARAGLLSAWAQAGPLRLSLTFAMLAVMGFGANTVFPAWFARQHHAPLSHASNILALCNLTMIVGGLLAGARLARGGREAHLLWGLLLLSVLVSLPLFAPGNPQLLRIAALIAWLIATGALTAVVVAALPRVVADARHGAAAAGLLSQLTAIVTFIAPLIWLPILNSARWPLFILVVVVASGAAALLFPRAADS